MSKVALKMGEGNFKALYNKKYGDIAMVAINRKYTPEEVFDFAVRYFSWAESEAIKAIETAAFRGVVSENLVHKPRVFTLTGLALFMGVNINRFASWRTEAGYSDVMEFIDNVIYEQKYQLGVAGIINPTIVGKELGIDKPQEITISNNSTANDVDSMKEALESVISKL
ncbi:terminase small subunit [Escherichia phage vB_EcoS_IME542]|uniref:Terminase small subunit n=1 Tax=Escherichia phage vB_EcoS_IME542 TaxID=2507711 RepID=A0A410T608_9CAUD|nr:terminase small subunit [Nitratidesulfovibrio liaohensis]YP_009824911.1 terminase small subunit [Escherichia phage vB_EcoS_IME542]NHZ46713.1 terminase [Nitratidesulfovibrio liaohensis]QAU04412.1 terminase small subunit [Escherichia phage vB_EcoS_IME542]